MKIHVMTFLSCVALLWVWAGPLHAADAPPAEAPAVSGAPATQRSGISVAILDFDSADPANAEMGKQIAEMLSAVLSGENGFILVDRTSMSKVLQEHALNLSGVVNPDQAVQIGKLIGAKILITGKAFPMGKQMYVTAKIIGTETSLVEGVLVKDAQGADLGDMVVKLGEKVAERLREAGPKLIAQPDAPDALPELKLKLANRVKPVVAIVVTEAHVAEVQAARLDPAVETEFKLVLREAGFVVQDVKDNALAKWASSFKQDSGEAWPRSLAGVDVVITGEAFSEFQARIGNLVSCAGRAEINVIDKKTGKIIFAQRINTRAVDLAENIAGKKALQKAGHELVLQLLARFAQTLPVAAGAQQ